MLSLNAKPNVGSSKLIQISFAINLQVQRFKPRILVNKFFLILQFMNPKMTLQKNAYSYPRTAQKVFLSNFKKHCNNSYKFRDAFRIKKFSNMKMSICKVGFPCKYPPLFKKNEIVQSWNLFFRFDPPEGRLTISKLHLHGIFRENLFSKSLRFKYTCTTSIFQKSSKRVLFERIVKIEIMCQHSVDQFWPKSNYDIPNFTFLPFYFVELWCRGYVDKHKYSDQLVKHYFLALKTDIFL